MEKYYIEYVIRLLGFKDSTSEEVRDIFKMYVPVDL